MPNGRAEPFRIVLSPSQLPYSFSTYRFKMSGQGTSNLTGARMFAGEMVSHTLAAALIKDPDWSQLPARTPASIRRLLRRCLTRDLKRRLLDIASARLELEEATVEHA
jgi:hypothetical protein